VGVIGGVGPLATAYFAQQVVAMTKAQRDQDHVDMIIFNHASIPDRTAFVLGESQDDPGPILAQDAARLEAFGADFLVMPCNTAHYFTGRILDAITVPLLSIIEVTVAAAMRRVPGLGAVGLGAVGLGSVGLLATAGTVTSRVYHDAFGAHGIDVLVPDDEEQRQINTVIYEQVKAGQPVDIAAVRAVADALTARGAQVVVLGCTELSVLAVDYRLLDEPQFLDSTNELVRSTIIHAGNEVRA
jgi:aspartate racemase